MRTNLSKKLLAALLSLAMVLSLVGIQPASANAAAKLSVTKKASVTAEKTYTYKVTGVKKTQYIKVTKKASGVVVKYNNKKVSTSTKIKGTGKALSLKVTAPEKVANYNNAMTIKVYNKKNNKLVKTLTTTSKVVVTELAITNVEAATYDKDTSGELEVKYLSVNFNKALESLDASEVSVRRDADGQLFTVEKVQLATNGKSAVITLLGNDAGTTANYVKPLTDYTLTVSQNGAKASLGFNIPQFDTGVVSVIDKENKTITVNGVKLYVSSSVDYDELLGEIVNVKYDYNQKLINVDKVETKVVYGTFYVNDKANSDGTYTLYDENSDASYTTQLSTVGANLFTSVYRYGTHKNSVVGEATTALTSNAWFVANADSDLDYCKVILNPNGTIRRIIELTGMTNANSLLVYAVKGNYVTDFNGTDKNFKDYTIVKDNKVIDLSAVVANDMIYFNSTTEIAVVYNNTVTGAVSNVYVDKATIADKTVVYSKVKKGNSTNGMYVDYIDTVVNEQNMNVVKAGGNATIYYTFNGSVNFIVGTEGEVTTTTKAYIVTKAFGTYEKKGEYYIYASLSDGTNVLDLDIPISQLLYASDYTSSADASSAATTMSIAAPGSAGVGYATITDGTTPVNLVAATTLADTNSTLGALVLVKTNAKGEVIGLYAPSTANLLNDGADFAKIPALGATTAKITNKNTPVFVVKDVDTDASNDGVVDKVGKVTATTLGAYAKVLTGSVVNSYVVDGTDLVSGTADYIIVYEYDINNVSKSSVVSYKKVVVKGLDKFTNASGNPEVANLKVVEVGTEETTTYSKFEDATDSDLVALAAGKVVLLGFDKDGNVVTSDTTDYNLVDLSSTVVINEAQYDFTTTTAEFSSARTLKYHKDSDHATTVYFVDGYGVYHLIAWTDIKDLLTDGHTFGTVKASEYKSVSDVTDVLVIYEGQSPYAAARAAIDPVITTYTMTKDTVANAQTAIKTAVVANVNAREAGLIAVGDVSVSAGDIVASTAGTYHVTVTISKNGYTKTIAAFEVVFTN